MARIRLFTDTYSGYCFLYINGELILHESMASDWAVDHVFAALEAAGVFAGHEAVHHVRTDLPKSISSRINFKKVPQTENELALEVMDISEYPDPHRHA